MNPIQKIQDLNIVLPEIKPLALYAPAVLAGDLVYVSGQLPMENGQVKYVGVVGEQVTVEVAAEAAKLCFLNALGALNSLITPMGKSLNDVLQVVKITGFVQASAGFTQHPEVVNGASAFCLEVFGEKGKHARAAVGVSSLPRNAAVEVEVIFQIR